MIFNFTDLKTIIENMFGKVQTDKISNTKQVPRVGLLTESVLEKVYFIDDVNTLPGFKFKLLNMFTRYPSFFDNSEIFKDVTLAGGAIRSLVDETSAGDVDLFFDSKEHYDRVYNALYFKQSKFGLYDQSRDTSTFLHRDSGLKYNLVGFNFFDNPLDLLDTFDFTCTAAAFKNDRIYQSTNFFGYAQNKVIRLHGLVNPYRTAARLERYLKVYGYRMHSSFLPDFVRFSNEKKFSDIWNNYGE